MQALALNYSSTVEGETLPGKPCANKTHQGHYGWGIPLGEVSRFIVIEKEPFGLQSP